MKRRCRIPSYRVGLCDDEWGHDGMMHQNAGDGFYARDYEQEHKRRQVARRRALTSARSKRKK